MSEIPEDIMAKAQEVLVTALTASRAKSADDGFRIIARALLAEREANAATRENECREAEKRGIAKGLEMAARVGYVTCAQTRHVRLGDEVATAIRAMKEG